METISNADNQKAAELKNNSLLTVNRGLSIKAEKGRDLQTTDQVINNDASSPMGSENLVND